MFSLVSVFLFTGEGGGSACDHYIKHWTVLGPPCGHQTWDPSPRHQTSDPHHGQQAWDPQPVHYLVTSGGHHWKPVQTCSFEDPPAPPGSEIWWPKRVQLASGLTHLTGILSCFKICHKINLAQTMKPRL